MVWVLPRRQRIQLVRGEKDVLGDFRVLPYAAASAKHPTESTLREPNQPLEGLEMCNKHCWSSWTTEKHEIDKGVFVWYLKRYCYLCSLKEWV